MICCQRSHICDINSIFTSICGFISCDFFCIFDHLLDNPLNAGQRTTFTTSTSISTSKRKISQLQLRVARWLLIIYRRLSACIMLQLASAATVFFIFLGENLANVANAVCAFCVIVLLCSQKSGVCGVCSCCPWSFTPFWLSSPAHRQSFTFSQSIITIFQLVAVSWHAIHLDWILYDWILYGSPPRQAQAGRGGFALFPRRALDGA